MTPDFTAYDYPVLAVPCPECRAAVGAMCRRPSGHRASDAHKARKTTADTEFIEQHGETASITKQDGKWVIDPNGRPSTS